MSKGPEDVSTRPRPRGGVVGGLAEGVVSNSVHVCLEVGWLDNGLVRHTGGDHLA